MSYPLNSSDEVMETMEPSAVMAIGCKSDPVAVKDLYLKELV